MAQYFTVHPTDPQPRLIRQAAEILRARRRHRVSDRFELCARLPSGRRGRCEAHARDPRRRRRASPHARVPRPGRRGSVRAHRQLAVPHRAPGRSGPVHVSCCRRRAKCRGACCIRKRTRWASACPTTPSCARCSRSCAPADPVDHIDPAGDDGAAQRPGRDPRRCERRSISSIDAGPCAAVPDDGRRPVDRSRDDHCGWAPAIRRVSGCTADFSPRANRVGLARPSKVKWRRKWIFARDRCALSGAGGLGDHIARSGPRLRRPHLRRPDRVDAGTGDAQPDQAHRPDRHGSRCPACCSLMSAPFLFGWAKPVPVNFGNLRHPKRDMIWVAGAGPAANFVMARRVGVPAGRHGTFGTMVERRAVQDGGDRVQDQPGVDGVEPASDSAAGRRAHRGGIAAASRGGWLSRASSPTDSS